MRGRGITGTIAPPKGAGVAVRESLAYRFIKAVARPIMMAVTKRDWRGMEHIPSAGGVVLAANHTSYFDPLAVAHFIVDAGRAPRFLGKAEIVAMPVLGRLFQAAGQIPVYRGTASAANAYRDGISALVAGEAVALYPEGTTTLEPDFWPMIGKTGAARMALTTGVPVIPIAQWGPHEVIPEKTKFSIHLFPRKTMRVRAGAAVNLDDLRGRELTSEVLDDATERIMSAITSILEDIRGESAPVERYDPRKHRGEKR